MNIGHGNRSKELFSPQNLARWPFTSNPDKLIHAVPVNLPNHWILLVFNFPLKTCNLYDSLFGFEASGQKALGHIKSFFEFKWKVDWSGWTFNTPVCPKQQDGTSCGAFVCKFASVISAGQLPPKSWDACTVRQEIHDQLLKVQPPEMQASAALIHQSVQSKLPFPAILSSLASKIGSISPVASKQLEAYMTALVILISKCVALLFVFSFNSFP